MNVCVVGGLVVALGACGNVKEVPPPGVDSGGGDDAPVGVCTTWTASNFTPCTDDSLPAAALTLDSDATFDTDLRKLTVAGTDVPVQTKSLTQPGGPNVALLSVRDLTVAAGVTLRVTGSNGLIIAVHGTAMIAGTIDASADLGQPGPGGSNGAACAGLTGASGTISTGAAGAGAGGGGGFGAAGGAGGCASNCPVPGGTGGASIDPAARLIPLRGGCSGGNGGGAGAGSGGSRGAGGGALEISALTSIAIPTTGVVRAAGGGGDSGKGNAGGGGGGGGAGGAILIEAASVSLDGSACANGGAGGEGLSSNVAEGAGVGANGSCSELFNAVAPKLGAGGNGGLGGADDSRPGGIGANGVGTGDSGGGGGGGVGVIQLSSSAVVPAAATVTPAPTFF